MHTASVPASKGRVRLGRGASTGIGLHTGVAGTPKPAKVFMHTCVVAHVGSHCGFSMDDGPLARGALALKVRVGGSEHPEKSAVKILKVKSARFKDLSPVKVPNWDVRPNEAAEVFDQNITTFA